MPSKVIVRKITLAVLLFGAGMAHTIPVPILDVRSLEQESDLIAVGTVVSIRDGGAASVNSPEGPISARLVMASMEVEETLKGAASDRTISFRYILPDVATGYASIVPGYQMLFLKNSEAGYAPSSPYHLSLPALRGIHDAGEGNVLSKIIFHLSAVVGSESAPLSQRQISLFALSTILNPESTASLRRALQEQDENLRLSAAGFLLQRNDISGLSMAEHALMKPDMLPRNLIHNIDYAIGQGVVDQKAVPILRRLAASQDIETRRATASALRHTGSRSALGALAMMLDDSDFQVRHEVVLGLAQITGDLDWGPNMELFRSEEGKYIKHWHEWKAANNPN